MQHSVDSDAGLIATILKIALAAFLALLLAGYYMSSRADEIGCVDTAFVLIGPNHKVCVYAFDDPRVPGVACHLSQARAGGGLAWFGVGEDPSRFNLACRQVGPITAALGSLPVNEDVFKANTSWLWKKTRVIRMLDPRRGTLVYVAISDKLIDGSPQNSISTVPVMPWVADKVTSIPKTPPSGPPPSVPVSK